jgi:hypothetical protein
MSNNIHEKCIWKSVRLERLPWEKDKRRTIVAMFLDYLQFTIGSNGWERGDQ